MSAATGERRLIVVGSQQQRTHIGFREAMP